MSQWHALSHLLTIVFGLLLLHECFWNNLEDIFIHKDMTQTDPLGIELSAATPHKSEVEHVQQIFGHGGASSFNGQTMSSRNRAIRILKVSGNVGSIHSTCTPSNHEDNQLLAPFR